MDGETHALQLRPGADAGGPSSARAETALEPALEPASGMLAVFDDLRQVVADVAFHGDAALCAGRALAESEARRHADVVGENARLRAEVASQQTTMQALIDRVQTLRAREQQADARVVALEAELADLRDGASRSPTTLRRQPTDELSVHETALCVLAEEDALEQTRDVVAATAVAAAAVAAPSAPRLTPLPATDLRRGEVVLAVPLPTSAAACAEHGSAPRASCTALTPLGGATTAQSPRPAAVDVYAVARGRTRGIFRTWDEAHEQVRHYADALYKSFKTVAEAWEWLGAHADAERGDGAERAPKRPCHAERDASPTRSPRAPHARSDTSPRFVSPAPAPAQAAAADAPVAPPSARAVAAGAHARRTPPLDTAAAAPAVERAGGARAAQPSPAPRLEVAVGDTEPPMMSGYIHKLSIKASSKLFEAQLSALAPRV